MSFFVKSNIISGMYDLVVDVLVSLLSNDFYMFVSVVVLCNSDIYVVINIIVSDIVSNLIMCDMVIFNMMINQVFNSQMDGYYFKYVLVVNLLLNGNSFVEILFNYMLKLIVNN